MKENKWFWGLFFICAAALIIVNQLGYFSQINVFSLFVMILLIPVMIKSIQHLNFSGILFPLAILAIIFSEPLGIEHLTPWPVLATAFLGSIGLHIIFGKKSHICRHKDYFSDTNYSRRHEAGTVTNSSVKDDANIVECKAFFSASTKYINSNNLEKVIIDSSFGGVKVFFDNVELNPNGAEVNIESSFSGIELYIPRQWNVENKANIILGGIDEKNRRGEITGPTLTITGRLQFCGVEIVYI